MDVSGLTRVRKDCVSALRGAGACRLLVGCVPFFAIHVFLEHQASAVRFVFPGGHGVAASGLQLRRFIRTGEFVGKWRSCTFQHSVVTLGRQYDQFQPFCEPSSHQPWRLGVLTLELRAGS